MKRTRYASDVIRPLGGMQLSARWLLTLALGIVVTLAACSGTGGGDEPDEPAASDSTSESQSGETSSEGNGEPVTLVMWSSVTEGPLADAENAHFRAFEEANPDVTIDVHRIPAQEFDAQFKTALAAGEQIDLVHVNVQFLRDYVTSGLLAGVDDVIEPFEDEFIDITWDHMREFALEDTVYGIPIMLHTTGFYYNTDLFDEYGLECPATWDDVRDIRDTIEPDGLAPLVYAGGEPFFNPLWFNLFFYQTTDNNGLAVNEEVMRGNASFDSAPYQEAIEHVVAMDREGILLEGHQGVDSAGATAAFIQGRTPMFYSGTWFISSLEPSDDEEESDDGEVSLENFSYDICPSPTLPGGDPQTPGSISHIYSISSGTEHREEAAALLTTMASDEFLEEMLSTPGAGVTLKPSLAGVHPAPAMSRFEEIAPTTEIWLDALWEPEIITAVQQGVQSAILGEQTPAEVTAQIARLYDQLRQDGDTFFD